MSKAIAQTANSCCQPVKAGVLAPLNTSSVSPRGQLQTAITQPAIPALALTGGTYKMGADGAVCSSEDAVGPAFDMSVEPFQLAVCAVTNDQFTAFVEATGYQTDAEIAGVSMVFYDQLTPDYLTRAVKEAPWWRVAEGACWRSPSGLNSNLDGLGDHPVIHVSWRDAQRFCQWACARLPTEAEWEFAARGGLAGCDYPWGDELTPNGRYHSNVWKGQFPNRQHISDRSSSTVPVDAFKPNQYGFWNMTGNVWEWCDNSFVPYIRYEQLVDFSEHELKAVRGGSWLCHESYCARYRVWSRTGSPLLSTTGHTGFRVAFDTEFQTENDLSPGDDT